MYLVPLPPYSKGWTPLHFAVKHGQIEVIEFIVANVTDKNPGDKSGMTPLLIAAAQGKLEAFKIIAKHLADKNIGNQDELTPLHLAAANGHTSVIEFILANMENRNDKILNPECKKHFKVGYAAPVGFTPLHYAAHKGKLEAYRMIAQHLKNKNPASKFGATPLHDAAMAKGVCYFKVQNYFPLFLAF